MNGNANIAEGLSAAAMQFGKQSAIIVPHHWIRSAVTTFTELDRVTDRFASGLNAIGVAPASHVAVMVPPDRDFASWIYALFKLGAIPVMIDPGMGVKGVGRCISDVSPTTFLGTSKAHWCRWLFRWGKNSIRIKVITDNLEVSSLWNECDIHARAQLLKMEETRFRTSHELASILFTSGSTGPAKGAVYTHGMFQEQLRVLRDVFQIEPGEVDLCTFPLFALFAPALGMTSIVPDMDPTRPAKADPKKLIETITKYNVTNLFGSPALIDVLSRYGEQNDIRLPTLKRVISAGAPVSAKIIERMARMLNPGVQVFTPYGATEALPIAVIGSDEILSETRFKTDEGAGICVGRPVGSIEVRIIPISDGPLPTLPDAIPNGEKGEITVRGPVVSRSYWNRPDADALHKIPDGDTVWHRTGDIGYFDDEGRLWFCGRKAHRVELPDQTLFTIPVEGVFNTHPDVFRTALVGLLKNGIRRAVLCVELEKSCRRRPNDIIPELESIRDRFPHTAQVGDFLFHSGFPVDIRHNAKINREKLAQWAARRAR